MLSREQLEILEPKIRVLQIICAALIMGVIGFGVVLAIITNWQNLHTLRYRW